MHDEAPLKGNSIYTKTKIIPHASSNDDQSHNYDKADDRHYCKSRPSTPPPDYGSCIASNGKISSHRQAGSSGGKSPGLPTASPALSEKDKKNVRDLRNDSKPHESRSSSPRKDDRQEKESSLYKESDDRSTAAIKRQTASKYIYYGSFGIIQLNFNIAIVIVGEKNNRRDRINAPPQYFTNISLNFHSTKLTFLKKLLISVCTKSYSCLKVSVVYHFDKHDTID